MSDKKHLEEIKRVLLEKGKEKPKRGRPRKSEKGEIVSKPHMMNSHIAKGKEMSIAALTFTNETKVSILSLLGERPSTVTEIKLALRKDQSNVSSILNKMLEDGLVKYSKDGKYRYYSLRKRKVKAIATKLQEYLSELSFLD